jgi:hypothetical protein
MYSTSKTIHSSFYYPLSPTNQDVSGEMISILRIKQRLPLIACKGWQTVGLEVGVELIYLIKL